MYSLVRSGGGREERAVRPNGPRVVRAVDVVWPGGVSSCSHSPLKASKALPTGGMTTGQLGFGGLNGRRTLGLGSLWILFSG